MNFETQAIQGQLQQRDPESEFETIAGLRVNRKEITRRL